MHNNVCAIVLNWNGWKDTIQCLNSLVPATSKLSKIIVVDNGSVDNSVEQLQCWGISRFGSFPTFQEGLYPSFIPPSPLFLIRKNRNMGYAAGNNTALRFALDKGCFDFFWILNNDTIAHVNALTALLKSAEQLPQFDIFGSTIIKNSDRNVVECGGGCRYNPLTTVFTPNFGGLNLKKIPFVRQGLLDYISGSAMFVRAEVFKECGLFNEEYFLYYEELDFCKRAKEKKYGLSWCKGSLVYHKGGGSIQRISKTEKVNTAFANYHENLSTLKYTYQFYPFFLPFVLVFRFAAKSLTAVKRGNWHLIHPLFKAYRSFLNYIYHRVVK